MKKNKTMVWALGALVWMAAGTGIGLGLGVHHSAPKPPYDLVRFQDPVRGPALNHSDDQRVVCVNLPEGSKMCFSDVVSNEDAMTAAQARLLEDKEVARAFWGVFTLAPAAFIFMVLFLIWRSGGKPAGFQRLEDENIPPQPR
jgi:hypothetical protein